MRGAATIRGGFRPESPPNSYVDGAGRRSPSNPASVSSNRRPSSTPAAPAISSRAAPRRSAPRRQYVRAAPSSHSTGRRYRPLQRPGCDQAGYCAEVEAAASCDQPGSQSVRAADLGIRALYRRFIAPGTTEDGRAPRVRALVAVVPNDSSRTTDLAALVSASSSWQPSPHGTSTKTWPSVSTSSTDTPGGTPVPTISPSSVM